MKRTLLAIGCAVLVSMMLILQTVLAAIAAAVIVNLFPRRPRK